MLEVSCPACGEPNRPGAKFSRKCGESLSAHHLTPIVPAPILQAPATYTPKHLAEKILTSKAALEGERKPDEALPLVAGAVQEFRGRQNHYWPGLILLWAGMTCLQTGRIDEAASHAREALALTRRLGARGSEAHALCLAGNVASTGGAEDPERYYREALALAGELGMRPLVQAQEHFTTAITMYREMDMRFWLGPAEAELADGRA